MKRHRELSGREHSASHGRFIEEYVSPCFHLSLSLSLCLSRCYTKTNGTFSSGTLPLMHRVAPCQQDGLEMVPLGQVSTQCHGPDSQTHSCEQEAEPGCQPDEHKDSSPSQHSCCLLGDNENYPGDDTGETNFYVHKSFCKYFLFFFFFFLLLKSFSKPGFAQCNFCANRGRLQVKLCLLLCHQARSERGRSGCRPSSCFSLASSSTEPSGTELKLHSICALLSQPAVLVVFPDLIFSLFQILSVPCRALPN